MCVCDRESGIEIVSEICSERERKREREIGCEEERREREITSHNLINNLYE